MKKIQTGTAAVALGFAIVAAAPGGAIAGGLKDGPEPMSAPPDRSIILGAAIVVKPTYEGGRRQRVIPIPMIIPKFSSEDDANPSMFKKIRRRVKFRGLDDVRIKAIRRGAVEVGGVIGYNTGRDEDDGDRLRGLGDVDGGLNLGGYVGLHAGSVLFDAALLSQVTGDDTGFQIRVGAETEKQISRRVSLVARIGTTFASDDYMSEYFGITPLQATRSAIGLPVFRASSGIKDVHLELAARIDIGERWTAKVGGRYGRLLSDAADSPLIESENQWSGTVGLGRKFYLGGR